MWWFYTIALAVLVFSFYIQFRIYDKTEKRLTLLIIPGVFVIPTLYIIITLGNESIFSPGIIYVLIAMFIGAPIVIGSLISGIIIAIRNR